MNTQLPPKPFLGVQGRSRRSESSPEERPLSAGSSRARRSFSESCHARGGLCARVPRHCQECVMCRKRGVLWSPERARMQGRSKCVQEAESARVGADPCGPQEPLCSFGLLRGWTWGACQRIEGSGQARCLCRCAACASCLSSSLQRAGSLTHSSLRTTRNCQP